MSGTLTDRQLQTLCNIGNESEDAANEIWTLRGERATLAGWIAEALSVLEKDAEGDDAKRLLIEQGNALVVAVRGGER